MALETVSLRTAIKEARHSKGESDVSWWTWLRKAKQPELPVVLLEDIGAETGLIFALGGVLHGRTSPTSPAGTPSARSPSACCSS